jgi:GABA permease
MKNDTRTYDGIHRILVVANETSAGGELHDLVSARARREHAPHSAVLVLAPALNSRLRHLFSDSDPAIRQAELRLAHCVEGLRRRGIEAAGIVGDEDPLRAIEDILHTFPADELVISTHVRARSNWLAREVIPRARARFALPTAHVVVDADRRAAEIVPLAA